jgi:AAA domain
MSDRIFEATEAAREQGPTLIGLIGPSSSGKTYSALRLAAGMQRVTGGDTFVIDTEAGRSKRYADKFVQWSGRKFNHVPFAPPFGPLDYLAAFEYCVAKGATNIIVDSMSHEHESIGGVLDMHAKMLAWGKPKRERRLMIGAMMQMKTNFIFCYRAKEKLEIKRGKDPLDLGWMPLGADEMIFEMSLNMLLYPLANGYPTWKTDEPGEKRIIKLPEEYRAIFADGPQLSEDVGEKLARWASEGQAAPTMDGPALISAYAACTSEATMTRLKVARGLAWPKLDKVMRERIAAEATAAKVRIDAALAALDEEDGSSDVDGEQSDADLEAAR